MIPSKEKYSQAIALWREWNAKINVISRRDTDSIFEHHILHSLAIAKYLEIYPQSMDGLASEGRATRGTKAGGPSRRDGGVSPKGELPQGQARQRTTVLDLGCGGGFPGIPLAMEWPDSQFTLCDSIGKKVRVAQAVADGLGLKNVECVNARVESLPGQWDWIVSRAVTSLENFYPWVKGRFRNSILYLKGGDIETEIAALQKKYHVPSENIRTWDINSWLNDEYFAEKFVIEVGKNYLCTP